MGRECEGAAARNGGEGDGGTSQLSLRHRHLPLSNSSQKLGLRNDQPRIPSVFGCPSSLGEMIVRSHCHPLLPGLPLLSPLDLLSQCGG